MEHQNLLRSLAKTVDAELRLQDAIPLLGYAPKFDLDLASSLIQERLETPSISLKTDAIEWRATDQLKDGLGSDVVSLPIVMTPLASQALWMMPKEDIARLTSWLLYGHVKSRPVTSEILQEGFYRYLALQTLDVLQEMEPLKDFSLKIGSEEFAGSERWYCIDVKIKLERRVCWGRLAMSQELLLAWQRHFASIREFFSLSSLAESLDVFPAIRVGSFVLSQEEWSRVHPGDFIPLDRASCTSAYLCLGSSPLFYINLHEQQLELVDYARAYEDPMENTAPGSEESQATPIKDLPLLVSVELARLRMTVAELMKLTPGNLLDLPLESKQEVILSVGGKSIGRGELVSLGEAIGVRILEIA